MQIVDDEERAAVIKMQQAEIDKVFFYVKRETVERHIHMQLWETQGDIEVRQRSFVEPVPGY